MDLDAYQAFTDALRERLEADPRVLGLIACGSMARRDTRPDDWSDHDFLVGRSSFDGRLGRSHPLYSWGADRDPHVRWVQ